MKIFITGATGFIGSHLTKNLIEEGHQLFCTLLPNEANPFVDGNLITYNLQNAGIDKLIDFLKDNQIDGVIHLASFVQSGNHKSEEIEKLIDTNLKFSTIVLEAASQANVNWFINTGTYWQHYNNLDYSPVNLYAATKQAFQSIAQFYIDTHRIKFCTIMLFDTYGPNDTRPKIFNLWENIAKTGETLDMSPGDQIIDISFIDDIVSAFVLLANHLQNNHPQVTSGSIYAVKAEKRYTLKALATIYEEATGTKLNINWGAKPYREREVMIPWENGIAVPGWDAKVKIEVGISKFFN